jgi:hypothetical protein
LKLRLYTPLFIFALILSLIACNKTESIEEDSNEDIDVVILCGQSNAEGHTYSRFLANNISAEEYNYFSTGFENVKIRYKVTASRSKKFIPVRLGQGINDTNFGPEIGIADYFEKNAPNKKIFIIKYAFGGSSLHRLWRSPSSATPENPTGEFYQVLIDHCHESLNLLKEENYNPIVKAICWMQGEDDSLSLSTANEYRMLENNFINDLCNELKLYNENNISFISAGISNNPSWQYYKIVNDAKFQNSKGKNRYYIDTIKEGLTYNLEPELKPDLAHYDSLSMIKLGYLFAKTILENNLI